MIHLLIHGVGIRIDSDCKVVRDACRHDFGLLEVPHLDVEPFKLTVKSGPPPTWRRLGNLGDCAFYLAPRGQQRRRFFQSAWVQYEYRQRRATVTCANPTIAYETCYLVLQSYLGERLDEMRMHRVHGLGIAIGDRGVLALGPSGAGKSTLAWNTLQDPSVGLFSDDTPLVRGRTLWPFPTRLGLREKPPVEKQWLRDFVRVRYGSKPVLDAAYFQNQIASPAPLAAAVILAGRSNQILCRRVGRLRWTIALLRWLVVGHETPQVWQLYLRLSVWDGFKKSKILVSRLRTALGLINLPAYELTLSTDRRACAEFLVNLGRSPSNAPNAGGASTEYLRWIRAGSPIGS